MGKVINLQTRATNLPRRRFIQVTTTVGLHAAKHERCAESVRVVALERDCRLSQVGGNSLERSSSRVNMPRRTRQRAGNTTVPEGQKCHKH